MRRGREPGWDVIVLDVMLPKKDGFDVCRDLRRGGVRTPIILLTARTQEAEKVLGLELGADDYVTKPFSPRELRARIKARDAPAAATGRPSRTGSATSKWTSRGRKCVGRADPLTSRRSSSSCWRCSSGGAAAR